MKKAAALCFVIFSCKLCAQGGTPPDAAGKDRMATLMLHYATTYRMPDVTYDVAIKSFEGRPGSEKWHKVGDSLCTRIFHGGRQQSRVVRLNGRRPQKEDAKWRVIGKGHSGENDEDDMAGDFARLAREESPATIGWVRWDAIGGRRCAVLRVNHPIVDGDSARTESIYSDPETGVIQRIRYEWFASRWENMQTSMDYSETEVGNDRYYLLSSSAAIYEHNGKMFKVEWKWGNYRKFQTSTSITYGK